MEASLWVDWDAIAGKLAAMAPLSGVAAKIVPRADLKAIRLEEGSNGVCLACSNFDAPDASIIHD